MSQPAATTAVANAPTLAPSTAPARIASIDIIRGVVMVLMAIDHVRVYGGVPAGGVSAAIFFTRWITNFCAPAFVFLAGTSAYLYGRKHTDVSRFLVTRGIWFVLVDVTVLRVLWTFNFNFRQYMAANVIWCIGWSMIILAGLRKLPLRVVAAIALVVIFGHNLLDGVAGGLGQSLGDDWIGNLWRVLYLGFFASPVRLPGGAPLAVLYVLVPWFAVMAAGYAFGAIVTMEPARRNRLCLTIGLGAIALFLVLRGFNLYGDPGPWSSPGPPTPNGRPQLPALLSFLNTTKYPASLLFLLMTLGPTIALIPFLEKARGPVARFMTVFGKVPFFFYLLHIPLIHVAAMIVSKIRMGTVVPWLFTNLPIAPPRPPAGYQWSLKLLYIVWLIVVVILYFACRWYADLKERRKSRWMAYL